MLSWLNQPIKRASSSAFAQPQQRKNSRRFLAICLAPRALAAWHLTDEPTQG